MHRSSACFATFGNRSLTHSPLSRLGGLFALTSLRRFQKRIDPRRVNGGVFLGLNGTVIKSHGSADATGVSAAIKLAFSLSESGFTDRLVKRVAVGAKESHVEGAQDALRGSSGS